MNVPVHKNLFEPRYFYEIKKGKKKAFFLLQPSWPKGFFPQPDNVSHDDSFRDDQIISDSSGHSGNKGAPQDPKRPSGLNPANKHSKQDGGARWGRWGRGRQQPNGIFPSLRLVVVAGVKGRILGADGGWLPGGRSPGACGLGRVHASPPRLFTLDTH